MHVLDPMYLLVIKKNTREGKKASKQQPQKRGKEIRSHLEVAPD